MMSQAQRSAQAKYDKSHTRPVMLKLNRVSDADVLAKLDAVQNKQGYIKELVRENIRGNGETLSLDAIRMLIIPVAKRYELRKVYLFGSYARGEAKGHSDIDMLIEGGTLRSMMDYLRLTDELRQATGKTVDVVEYDAILADKTRSGRRFLAHVERDRVLIYE